MFYAKVEYGDKQMDIYTFERKKDRDEMVEKTQALYGKSYQLTDEEHTEYCHALDMLRNIDIEDRNLTIAFYQEKTLQKNDTYATAISAKVAKTCYREYL